MRPLSTLISSLSINRHLYADDRYSTLLLISPIQFWLKHYSPSKCCSTDLFLNDMIANLLTLNSFNTEFLLTGLKKQLAKILYTIPCSTQPTVLRTLGSSLTNTSPFQIGPHLSPNPASSSSCSSSTEGANSIMSNIAQRAGNSCVLWQLCCIHPSLHNSVVITNSFCQLIWTAYSLSSIYIIKYGVGSAVIWAEGILHLLYFQNSRKCIMVKARISFGTTAILTARQWRTRLDNK